MFQENLFLEVVEGFDAWVFGGIAKLFFDAEELVVFGNTIGSGHGTSLDLAGVESNDEVSDGGIFGFTGTVGDDAGPAISHGTLAGIKGFG